MVCYSFASSEPIIDGTHKNRSISYASRFSSLGRHFIGIELYDEYANIAEERCRQAHRVRSTYEAEHSLAFSTQALAVPLDDTMQDEVRHSWGMGVQSHASIVKGL
jgi:hypothetical protein